MKEKIYPTPYGDIHYWVNQNQNKQTLVFLPGLTANHHLFDKQISHFKDKYNLLVWDAPGHGVSRPFRLGFTLADKARFLNEILETENITNPILIGQSMGGYVSQMFIKLFGDKAAGFISIDSCPLNREYYTQIELDLLGRMESIYSVIPWKLLLKTGPKGCARTPYGQELMLKMMQDYEGDQPYYAHLAGHGFKILAEAVESDLNITFNCPVLLMCGEKDQAGSARRYNKLWAKRTGLPLKWIKDAGHNSNTDQPEIVNLLIEIFAEKIRLGKI